ncbi:Fibronectin type 3 and ankyrin repeat domains protein 1 [Trichoplax sp. H2]|nr:Fibronectin type 3 and ankyrin repeat domains protein 1 [Trichoplax sp. H2]|eukprot:RDD41952.1 Fibronectin type 3 and ankyrin repeat domains protein 1 [Trichoplax sp. H2]
MAAPCRPDPPVVGKVTHQSIELYWDEPPLEGTNGEVKHNNSTDRVRYCVQEDDSSRSLHPKGFGTVYTGYARNNIFQGLEAQCKYRYRLRASNSNGNSEWSPAVDVSTTRKPITGDDLHKAVNHQDKNAVILLLDENKSIIDLPDRYGLSPLMSAAQKGYYEVCEILIANNADVNRKNANGKTSFMLACFMGHLKIVRLLLKNGAVASETDNGGSTALHWAVDGGHIDVVRYLLENGAKVTQRDTVSGWTPIIRAAASGSNQRVVRVLIDHGASVNDKDPEGKTALMVGVINGSEEAIQVLLEHKADISYKNEYGKTALDFAQTFDRRRIVALFEKYREESA